VILVVFCVDSSLVSRVKLCCCSFSDYCESKSSLFVSLKLCLSLFNRVDVLDDDLFRLLKGDP